MYRSSVLCVCVFACMYEYVCVQVRAGVFGVAKAIILSGSRSGSSEDEEVCSMQYSHARTQMQVCCTCYSACVLVCAHVHVHMHVDTDTHKHNIYSHSHLLTHSITHTRSRNTIISWMQMRFSFTSLFAKYSRRCKLSSKW